MANEQHLLRAPCVGACGLSASLGGATTSTAGCARCVGFEGYLASRKLSVFFFCCGMMLCSCFFFLFVCLNVSFVFFVSECGMMCNCVFFYVLVSF